MFLMGMFIFCRDILLHSKTVKKGVMSPAGNQSQDTGHSSQGNQEDREFKLKDCIMEIVSVGKKDPLKDEFMTIDLVFKFEDDPVPKVVGELLINAD